METAPIQRVENAMQVSLQTPEFGQMLPVANDCIGARCSPTRHQMAILPGTHPGKRIAAVARCLAAPSSYQGCVVGPTVNSLTVVSAGCSIANATTLATRSGEMPWVLYSTCMPAEVPGSVIVLRSSVLIAAG